MKINTSQVFKEYSPVLNLLLRQRLAASVYLIGACFLSTAILAEPYDPKLGSKIDTYLGGQGSPITGNGAVFFANGVQDDVDPRLIVAIAGAESSFGTHWVNCPQSGFNAWSWFYKAGKPCSQSPFGSFADGINVVTAGMARYFNRNWNTIPIIGRHYCPLSQAGCGSWAPNVASFYTAQDGDTSDLTFHSHIALIDFEQLTAPFGGFGSVQPPLKVFAKINGTVSRNPADSATISGGSLVNATTFLPVDQSVVYGAKLSCEGCLPAFTIQFIRKVSNFSVFLMNGIDLTVTYMVEDDQGGMQTKTLAPNFDSGRATVMLPETGIRQVTVSGGSEGWDFFIDNIRFSPD